MSLNKTNLLDSYKDSNDYLNLLLNSQGSKSNYDLNSILPLHNHNGIKNIFSFEKEENIKVKSLLNNFNKNTHIIINKKEIFQIVKKEIQIEIIAGKKNDSDKKETSFKDNEKILNTIEPFPSTKLY